MRKRRKNPYTWFPVLGSIFTEGDVSFGNQLGFQTVIPELNNAFAPNIDNGSLAVFPVIPDFTTFQDNNSLNQSLRDVVQGQDWMLKRIVGKAHVNLACPTATTGQAWPLVIACLAFFVARANDDNQALCGLQDDEIDPLAVFNVEQPWIWRRTWQLGNDNGSIDWIESGAVAPNNKVAPGVMDGPHIDSKVSRRIRKEQRLWGALSVVGQSPFSISVTGDKDHQPKVNLALDVRILGTMRKAHNTSAF